MPSDSLIRQRSELTTTPAMPPSRLSAFDEPFWPWQWVVRWLYFRDIDRLNESWWHIAEQAAGASSPAQDRHADTTLMLALQMGRPRAFRKGIAVPREAWAGEPLRLRDKVHFRREDVLELWPAPAPRSQTPRIAPVPQTVAPQFGEALDAQIHDAIIAIYDQHEAAHRKPPNVRELGRPVLNLLHQQNITASLRRIEELAGQPSHKARRLPSGKWFRPRNSPR